MPYDPVGDFYFFIRDPAWFMRLSACVLVFSMVRCADSLITLILLSNVPFFGAFCSLFICISADSRA